jgi:hypothetical protein
LSSIFQICNSSRWCPPRLSGRPRPTSGRAD